PPAMVEFAIILPLLVMLLFGIIEFGWIFFKASQVNQAARMGSRIAIRPAATEDEVTDAIAAVMSGAGLGASGYTVSIGDLGVEVGEPVEVRVDVNYEDNIDLLGLPMIPIPDAIHGHAVMAKEGP
ncbi:MAG: TadE/TadG family type IV pilus assembly protein, partial [Tepidisphaeraceae bacterium]